MDITSIHNHKGIIQSIDGLVGLSIFSIAFIVLISSYAEFGYTSNSTISSTYQYILKEVNMQHTIYTLENSNTSIQNFKQIMKKSGYNYSVMQIKHDATFSQNSPIKRIVVIEGKMYSVWVN